jgi:hypothetical protein
VKNKNECNLKHLKAQNQKRSSSFNHKKSKYCIKPNIYFAKQNERKHSPLRNQYQNKMVNLYYNCDVKDMKMNQLVLTLKYELTFYTYKIVHKKFNCDQLHQKFAVMNEFMDVINEMKRNLKTISGMLVVKMATALNKDFLEEFECKTMNVNSICNK